MNRGALRGFGESARSGKPIRIVRITSGSGTFRPLVPNSRCVIRLVGGGGGGGGGSGTCGGGGGGAGAEIKKEISVPGPVTYAVGAKGLGGGIDTDGSSGSPTRLGTIVAPGGLFGTRGAAGNGLAGAGGDPAQVGATNFGGSSGGGGASGRTDATQYPSGAPGFPAANNRNGQALSGTGTKPGGAGGDSMCGPGGAGGNGGGAGSGTAGSSPSSTSYGGGGGGGGGGTVSGAPGGDGVGGYIEIEEYGL